MNDYPKALTGWVQPLNRRRWLSQQIISCLLSASAARPQLTLGEVYDALKDAGIAIENRYIKDTLTAAGFKDLVKGL